MPTSDGSSWTRIRRIALVTVSVVAVAVSLVLAVRTRGGGTAFAQRSTVCDGATIEQTGRINAALLPETSGITMSSTDGAYWAINDKGNTPDLVSVSAAGEVVSQLRVNGARNVDWEDLGSIDRAGHRLIIVADIGDNDEDRPSITLFVVEEPPAGAEAAVLRSELTLSYPDQPRNAEGLLVHPGGTAAVVVRGNDAVVYLIDDIAAVGQATMRSVGSVWNGAEIRAGAVSPDGSLVALRTESQIRVWELGSGSLAQFADAQSCTVNLKQKKPEAMSFNKHNQIVATGEGAAEIFVVTLELFG